MMPRFTRFLSVAATLAGAIVGMSTLDPAPLHAGPPLGTNSLSPQTGNSSTVFTLLPPSGAACSGSGSGTPSYRWQTFMVSASVDASTLTYSSGPNPVAGAYVQPLYDSAGGNPIVNRNPSSSPLGQITNIPTMSFAALVGFEPPAGVYKIGFACTQAGVVENGRFWETKITVDADMVNGGVANFDYRFGAVPAAPVVASPLTAGNGTLSGTFTASASAPATTGYTVTAVPTAGSTVSAALAAGATSFSLTGLTNGVTYAVSVKATNSLGDSLPSNAVNGTPVAPVVPPPPVPGFQAFAPSRLLDTRPGFATVDGLFAGIGLRGADSVTELQVGGRAAVPADAAAVVLNVTATGPAAPGFVTVFPCGADRPTASSLNYVAGATVPNAVISKLGTGGTLCLYTQAATHLIVDINGFFPKGSAYAPLNPARLLETRPGQSTIDGQANGGGVRGPGSITRLQVTGRAGVPADAAAAVLNVTVTEAQGPGYVTVFPCGSDQPNASSLNYVKGSTVANAVISKIGTEGTICLFTQAGTHLIVDVNGYLPGDGSFTPIVPARLLETRGGYATVDGQSNGIGQRGADSVTEVQVTGRAGVPADASAVVLNVTVAGPTGSGFVTVFPCGSDRPNSSNLNYTAGDTVPNAAIAKVGTGGKVCFYTQAATDLIVDINGYFVPTS